MKQKKLKESIRLFRSLAENSPLEAPVAGFNRHLRYMSPNTREMVLKAREPEIMAFAEDRKVDPQIVLGIAEATMRLGRIPDVGMYGLAGDEALAVKDFIADTILNVAEDELNLIAPMAEASENGSPKGKHLKLSSDYKKLADFHTRRAKEETDKGKFDKENGRAHSAIRANSAAEQHKTLASHCAGLADYHQIKANEITGNNVSPPEYPAENPKKSPPEPPQNYSKKEETPHKVSEPKDRVSKEDDEVEPENEPPAVKDEAFSAAVSKFKKFRTEDDDQPSLNSRAGAAVSGAAGNVLGKIAGTVTGNPAVGQIASKALGAAGNAIGSKMGLTGVATNAALSAAPIVGPMLGGLYSAKKLFSGKSADAAPAPGQPPAPPNPPQTEQTVSGAIRGPVVPVGASAFPTRMNSILPVIKREPVQTQFTQWEGKDAIQREIARGDINRKGYDKNDASESGTENPKADPKKDKKPGTKAELDRDNFGQVESIRGKFRQADFIDDLLEQSKAKKKAAKKESSKEVEPEQTKRKTANQKIAPLFHHLGHKIDHAATKAEGAPYSEKWANKLKDLCVKDGGSAASDEVIRYSLQNPWIRESGFTDESSNLRRKWETAMSDDARDHAMESPTAPEPVVLTIGRFIKMSDK
jgi:hypothetical protein